MEIKDIVRQAADSFDTKLRHGIPLEDMVCLELYQAANAGIINYDNAKFCVLDENADYDRIIKLSTLMPTPITLTNLNSTVTQIDHGVCLDETMQNKNYHPATRGLSEYEVLCHLPKPGLISNCLDLFTEGIIQYYPNTAYYFYHPDGSEEFSRKNTITFSGGMIHDDYPTTISKSVIDAALTLNIPYIYDVPIHDYSNVTLENTDALARFRKFFWDNVVNVDWKNTKERGEFENELKANVGNIESLYKKEMLKFRKSLAIGAFATALVSLYVFPDSDELLKTIVGFSGGTGLLHFLTSILDFCVEKVTIKEMDCYFLWVCHNNLQK